jgi:hypothetical protein
LKGAIEKKKFSRRTKKIKITRIEINIINKNNVVVK